MLSAELHYTSWRHALAEAGVTMTHEQFWETFGQRNEEILRRFLGPDAEPALLARVADRKERAYRELAAERAALAPGAEAWLQEAARRGIRHAIASSTPRENVEVVLGRLGIRDRFAAVCAAEDVERGKPAPDIFLAAARALGCTPADCLVVEDAPAGVAAAKAADMRCLAVASGHPPERLAEADLVVASLAERSPAAVLAALYAEG